MNFKSVALASALALGAFSAQAANNNLGVLGTALVNSGGLALAPGVVNDNFTFSLSAASDVQSNVTTFIGSLSPAYYGIFSTGADHVIGGGDDVAIASFAFGNTSASHTTTLAAGSYYFNVFALATAAPTAYAISATATALPVPEPESYAMLGAGLAAIGFIVSRRRRES